MWVPGNRRPNPREKQRVPEIGVKKDSDKTNVHQGKTGAAGKKVLEDIASRK